MFCKEKVFLGISQNSQGNTCITASFLIKLQAACNFIKKETLEPVFSCKFSKFSKSTFSTEHVKTTSSVFVHPKCNWIIWPRYSQRSHVNNNKKVLKFLECLSELNRTVFQPEVSHNRLLYGRRKLLGGKSTLCCQMGNLASGESHFLKGRIQGARKRGSF